MKKGGMLLMLMMAGVLPAWAQCAMCRTTLENNVSNGDIGIAAGINTGILYLFFAPYLAIGVIAFFWYRTSKRNAQAQLAKRTLAG
ncbi:MAG: hypothetical protein MUC38_05885 [Cyclobacteriaceae bacterium]|nr:hypothetical protein [Cyclobacteriaceae bacterium]